MIDLVAKRGCKYGGRRLLAGHLFRAPKPDARALIASGFAVAAKQSAPEEDKPKRRPRKYDTRHLTASDE